MAAALDRATGFVTVWYRIAEIPIVWRNDPRSQIRLVRDSFGMRLDLGRVRITAWTGCDALSPGRSATPSERTP